MTGLCSASRTTHSWQVQRGQRAPGQKGWWEAMDPEVLHHSTEAFGLLLSTALQTPPSPPPPPPWPVVGELVSTLRGEG